MESCSFCPTLANDGNSLVEVCRNDLRRLEHDALEAVLHAFRAQGPLDLYKEVLLDHLKECLFISREDYIFKVDHIATNSKLKHICDTLNPSYAQTDANWLLERQSVLPLDYRMHMNRLGRNVTDIFDPSRISEELWMQMYKDSENEKRQSLAKLLTLKKKPFTPECLRTILISSEQSDRVDCLPVVSTQTEDVDKVPALPVSTFDRKNVETQTEKSIKVESTPGPIASTSQQDNQETGSDCAIPASHKNNTHVNCFVFMEALNPDVSFNQFMKNRYSKLTLQSKRRQAPNLKSKYKLFRESAIQSEMRFNQDSPESTPNRD